MMIHKPLNFDVSGTYVCQKNVKIKNFKQKLRHQVVEGTKVEAEAIRTKSHESTKFGICVDFY